MWWRGSLVIRGGRGRRSRKGSVAARRLLLLVRRHLRRWGTVGRGRLLLRYPLLVFALSVGVVACRRWGRQGSASVDGEAVHRRNGLLRRLLLVLMGSGGKLVVGRRGVDVGRGRDATGSARGGRNSPRGVRGLCLLLDGLHHPDESVGVLHRHSAEVGDEVGALLVAGDGALCEKTRETKRKSERVATEREEARLCSPVHFRGIFRPRGRRKPQWQHQLVVMLE